MNLKIYFETTGRERGEFARAIGVTPQALSRYEAGTRTPKPEVMTRVFVASCGLVTPNDFHDLPAAPSEAAVSAEAAA